MYKYAVLVSYLGTQFCGWQRQKTSHLPNGKTSIQFRIEEALQKMTGESVSVVGSGRTDSGVHALGQVAHFVLKNKEWDASILLRGLNGLLRPSIQTLFVTRVALDFHSQRSAKKKQYSYYFQQGPCAIPHFEPLSWWIHKKLDLDAMQAALDDLKGEHDFKAFQASGAKPGPTVRTLLEAEISLQPILFPPIEPSGFFDPFRLTPRLGLVRVRVVGTGFLKQMVRGIAGTLLQIGESRRPASCMKEILQSQSRLGVGPTAPSRALWLERVWYPEQFELPWEIS